MNKQQESASHKKVRLAITAIKKGRAKDPKNKKLTVSSVAREADVSRMLIQRDMPDLYEVIIGQTGSEQQKDRIKTLHDKLKIEEDKRKKRDDRIAELEEMLANNSSINATLMKENKELRVKLGLPDNVTSLFT